MKKIIYRTVIKLIDKNLPDFKGQKLTAIIDVKKKIIMVEELNEQSQLKDNKYLNQLAALIKSDIIKIRIDKEKKDIQFFALQGKIFKIIDLN